MIGDSPGQVIERFASALSRGDLDGAMALYDPEATLAPRPGEQVTGLEGIRASLEQFAALKPSLTGDITKVLTAGDIALVMNRWRLTAGRHAGRDERSQRGRSSPQRRRRLARLDRRPLEWRLVGRAPGCRAGYKTGTSARSRAGTYVHWQSAETVRSPRKTCPGVPANGRTFPTRLFLVMKGSRFSLRN
jgi:uncharacterized protein (TIGR02246 family)